jgi:hypothetical protein
VGTRTDLYGAYRHAHGGVLLPIVETFRFRAQDTLLGGEGWTLTTIKEAHTESALHIQASGDWAHPLHVGNWHRTVMTNVDATFTSNDVRYSINYQLVSTQLKVTFGNTTKVIDLPSGSLLVPPAHAAVGMAIDLIAQTGMETTVIMPSGESTQLDPFVPELKRLSATRTGRSTISTPDGDVSGESITIDEHLYIMSGDGTIAASKINDLLVWQVAPSQSG